MSYEDLFLGKRIVACDTETTGLNFHGAFSDYGYYPARPFVFSFTTYEGCNWYVRFEVDTYTRRVMYEKNIEEYYKLVFFFGRKDIVTVWHNANFDLSVIKRINIDVNNHISDTMILSYVSNCQMPTALKTLCEKFFNISTEDQKDLITSVNKARKVAKKKTWCIATKENGFGNEPNLADYWLGDKDLCKQYAITDTDRTMGLYYSFEERYKTDYIYKSLVDMEHDVMHILRKMQDIGVCMDENKIEVLIKYYSNIIKKQNIIKKNLGYKTLNPKSSKQMREVFYNKLGCEPVFKKRKNKESFGSKDTLTVDTETLNSWAVKIPLAKCLLEISASEHELNTFIKPFKESSIATSDGKVLRPNYRSVGTVTGRISCAKPNLMNISSNDSTKRLSNTLYRSRECFIPKKDKVLIFFDYSQIEVWIASFLSGDKIMTEYLLSGGDLHIKTGESVFGHKKDYEENKILYRKKGKVLNFGSIYGMGASKLMLQIDCAFFEAERALGKFWGTYIGLNAYKSLLSDKIKLEGKMTNPFGREYFLDSDFAYRALNYMVQGSASEVLKRAMINVSKILNPEKANLILTIHDELCIEVDKSIFNKFFIRSILKEMQSNFHIYFNMPVPFKVSVSYTKTNWAEKKEILI